MFKQAAPFLFCPTCFLFRVNPRHILMSIPRSKAQVCVYLCVLLMVEFLTDFLVLWEGWQGRAVSEGDVLPAVKCD